MNNNENKGLSGKSPEELSSSEELSDDMEMVSPGVMLREAREKLGLTQDDIANRLNFKVSLVESIEKDNLDPQLPETFNRGYLSSYAKVVAVEIVDILASHDAVGAAQTQRSELQSFSNLTIKEAEHSRVMWLSYLIIAILVGLTVLWWMQEEEQQTGISETNPAIVEKPNDAVRESLSVQNSSKKAELRQPVTTPNADDLNTQEQIDLASDKANTIAAEQLLNVEEDSSLVNEIENSVEQQQTNTNESENSAQPLDNDSAHAVFTFSGDCWVNIYDATGERVAWGVKKSGYVMTVKGKAPLRVTLGKPELATISYNEQLVDMSGFNAGNIAKFTLPLSANEAR